MAAGVTIKCKRKNGAFVNGELAQAEWGYDITNDRWYYSTNGTTVTLLSIPAAALATLSDVVLTSPADNNVLTYDQATSKWTSQTAAQAGLAAATHTHDAGDLTGNIATARMQTNAVAAVQAGSGTISNSALVIDGGVL